MKRLFVIALAMLLTVSIASVSSAAITGTDHDFSGSPYSGGKICIVCHTPHNSNTAVTNAPLWNHSVTTATFTPYSGQGTLDASVAQPGGISKLCLSCHDGTVAIDSFGGATGTSFISGGERLSTDLTNDHPVSFTYDDALASADGELAVPSTASSGLGSTIADDMLFNGNLECASCHDVHDNTNQPFLRKADTGSALCLTCHTK